MATKDTRTVISSFGSSCEVSKPDVSSELRKLRANLAVWRKSRLRWMVTTIVLVQLIPNISTLLEGVGLIR